MSLDQSRLENVHPSGGKVLSRCPACAEQGGDKTGDHLFQAADGKWGCIQFPGDAGHDHRKRIFALVGVNDLAPATPNAAPVKKSVQCKGKLHQTADDAARAALWAMEQDKGRKYRETARNLFHAAEVEAYEIRGEPVNAVPDENGKTEKTFRTIHRDGNGWRAGDPPGLWPIYDLSNVAKSSGIVTLHEGVKAALAAQSVGLTATAFAHGSKSPQITNWTPLAGREVVYFPDHDDDGRECAQAVAKILTSLTPPAAVKIVTLPGLPPKGDFHEFVEAHDAQLPEDIRAEVEQLVTAAPVWTPPEGAELADDNADTPTPEAAPVDAGDWLETEPPPVAPILHGLFELGDKFEVIGGSKTRKTFFTLQAALCLTAGREFLGLRVDHPWRVLLVQMEVKPRHFHRRVYKLAKALGLIRADLGGRLQVLNGRGLKLSGAAFFEHVRKLAEVHRAEIIIFDPLYKITVGDENAAADIKPTLAEFDRLAEGTGAAVGYVHHDSKGDAGARSNVDRGAGSGVLARDCDARIILTAHDSEPDAFVVETVTRNFAPQDGFTIGWGETDTGYCFQTMPNTPALKRTQKSLQAGPRLVSHVEKCIDLIGAPMPLGDLIAKIQMRASVGRDKARDIAKGLATRPGVCCRQAKANGARWYIGAADQMETLPGEVTR